MNKDTVIKVDNVSMKFNLGKEKIDSLKEYIIKLLKGQLMYTEFWALQNINLEVKRGEVVGIIGYNGSGKSTLLKIIAGVMKPTKGLVTIKGSMAPLIELGAGFDPDLTGRENIYLNASILGYTKQFISSKYEEIVEFAELENFIDVPIKNYSSGMKARLGFAIATLVEPEILIVDEVLSVGDFKFQEKCQKRIREVIEKGTTVLFVSHSIKQVESLCDRVLWIHKGEYKGIGPAREMCEQFVNFK